MRQRSLAMIAVMETQSIYALYQQNEEGGKGQIITENIGSAYSITVCQASQCSFQHAPQNFTRQSLDSINALKKSLF